MLERFTRDARAAVAAATDEARRLGAPAVGAEHLLIATVARCSPLTWFGVATPVLHAPSGAFLAVGEPPVTAEKLRTRLAADDPDAEALKTIGISLLEVRRRMEEAFGPQVWRDPRRRRRLPFSAEAKRALELALREALELRTKRIDSRHILLVLLRHDPMSRGLIVELGVDPDAVASRTRSSILELQRFVAP